MKAKNSVYIIIPSFNEAEVIGDTIEPLLKEGYEVVVVDDASTDRTEQLLDGKKIHYLKHRVNLGQGAAIQTGINYAFKKGAEIFVTFDADGQHDETDIGELTRKLENEGLDVVLGSRFLVGSVTNMGLGRRIILWFGRWLNYIFTGILLTDAHNGLRVFNRKTAGILNLKENRMAHATEILLQIKKHRLRYGEAPSHIRYTNYSRKKGQSLLNSVKIFFELVLNKLFD